MVRTVIVIPVYGKLNYLKKCVDSIRRNTEDYQIVAVDDVSPDNETLPWLKEQKDIDLIIHKKNCGFTKTVNDGIRYARKKYNPEFVVPMNTDVIVFKQWLKTLIAYMDAYPQVMVASPFYSFGGMVDEWPMERRLTYLVNRYPTYQTLSPKGTIYNLRVERRGDFHVMWAVMIGCCFLIRCTVFDEVGYLDERLRMFWSDEEFKFRLMEHKKGIYQVIDSRIHHYLSKTTRKNEVTTKKDKLDNDLRKDTDLFIKMYPHILEFVKEQFYQGYAGRGFEV